MEGIVRPPAPWPVSGFWRRLGAFVIDGLALGAVGAAAGFLLFDTLAHLGIYARAVGFVVALTYFGLLNSRLGGGQTLGKMAVSIRVTPVAGGLLSVPRSLLRYSVLGIPFFLNNAELPARVVFSTWGYVVAVIVFGGLSSILYLFVFNRDTRRSLHDYAAGSWVVRSDAATSSTDAVSPLWRGHVVVVAVLFTAGLLAPMVAQRVSQQLPVFDAMLPALDALGREEGVMYANLNVGTASNGNRSQTFTAAMVELAHAGVDDEALARHMARTIVHVSPTLGQRDVVAVNLRYGFDLGFASGWHQHQFQFAPGQLE